MTSERTAGFHKLLLQYSQEMDAAERKKIDKMLWDEFGVTRTVLVLDMTGFSKLTQRHGVVHYLSMVRRMQMTAEPIIDSYGGTVVKFEADDCFATFLDPLKAVRCSIALNLAFNAANILTPDELDIGISCGIDHGPILVVDGKDFFGNPVNRACKLGEDVSGPGEIIVTQEAMAEIPEQADIEFDAVQFNISGISIDAYVVNHWRKSGQMEMPKEASD